LFDLKLIPSLKVFFSKFHLEDGSVGVHGDDLTPRRGRDLLLPEDQILTNVKKG
jgi:hypothetical protein